MHYNDIPKRVRRYLTTTRRQFNRLPHQAQKILLDAAWREYARERRDRVVESIPVDDSSFTIRLSKHRRSTTLRGRSYPWKSLVLTIDLGGYIITEDNLQSFAEYMDLIRDAYTDNGYTPYQYTFFGGGYVFNTRPNASDVILRLTDKLDEYEESFVLSTAIIRLRKGRTSRTLDQGLVAGYGEGIPRSLGNGFWALSLTKSRTKCILNAYVSWMLYRSVTLDEVIMGDFTEYNKLKDQCNTHLPVGLLSIADIQEMTPHEYRVIYQVDSLDDITPEDTVESCMYLYARNHVELVIHEQYLHDTTVVQLAKLAGTTFLHVIDPKTPKTDLVDIIVADVESYREELSNKSHRHVPYLVGVYSETLGFKAFRGEDSVIRCLDYLTGLSGDNVIWFHNGGRYDTHLFLGPIMDICNGDLMNPLQILDVNGKLVQVRLETINGSLTIRDSCSIIPGSLARLAADFGCTNKLDDVDILNVTREDLMNSPKILEYNQVDCIALYEVLTKYQDSTLKVLGSNPLHHVSASSFAKTLFYSTYYNVRKYPLYRLSQTVHEFISRGYQGGRCEVFKRGKFREDTRIVPYDFTSMYPAAGKKKVPYGKPKYVSNLEYISSLAMDAYLEDNPGFYEVTVVHTPRDKLPLHGVYQDCRYIFPYITNSGGHVIFSEELRKGLSIGYTYVLHQGYTQPLAPICRKFFKDLFAVKKQASAEGHKAQEYTAKITVNAAYGFFGFNAYDRPVLRAYGKSMEAHLEALADNGQVHYREEGNGFLAYERTNVPLEDINVAVAAAITSYARMTLWELLQDIKDHGGILYYCDTDSVYSNIDIAKHPVLGPKWCGNNGGKDLGGLKRELADDEYISKACFVGCKTYGYITMEDVPNPKPKYVVKSKGTDHIKPLGKRMHGESKEEYTRREKAKQKEYKTMYKAISGLLDGPCEFKSSSIVVSRMHKVTKDMDIVDKTITKTIHGVYTKGIIHEDGTVTPLDLSPEHPVEW
ncbi:hypothetical protein K457DRAFT_26409 [Linnemannia elongata AG-77]|uniref:Probable DNA polymerase n=1 Tax=Linnemannia elongata AG-77 TaxID=1314771 RepID=A0A197JAH0_9FUNG|nr:hypothetical protein K457DRAFT_26409 [Linnemannia elongata AG-77]